MLEGVGGQISQEFFRTLLERLLLLTHIPHLNLKKFLFSGWG